ncbi:MAG: RimK family protein [Nitrospinota bacterium]|nr:RimK family protein [Nitrospinota bacterium]MDH5757194.1 RimK family protein [Nitrospinota bacterium]
MRTIIVVNKPSRWPLQIPGVDIIAAKDYLMMADFGEYRGMSVFNMCRSYRYQSFGYYVSLLAEARGHRPSPSVSTILDMRSQATARAISWELESLIEKTLAPIKSDKFTLSVYFGKNMAQRYDRLCARIFNAFHAPFLQAQFVKGKKWALQSVGPIAGEDIPKTHIEFVLEAANAYFSKRRIRVARPKRTRYDLAILVNDQEPSPPSNEKALRKFVKAAERAEYSAEFISKEDYGRLIEFDALFIRETTAVNHHTFRFAKRAETEGLAVIDDSESILKCTNKVFLAELLEKRKIPAPKTVIVSKESDRSSVLKLNFPMILKRPDSSFSQGVVKVDSEEQLAEQFTILFKYSDLLLAQEFMPTDFDWRVGILDDQVLYACRYHMADGHWQIINHTAQGDDRYGNVESVPVHKAPKSVISVAARAARLIGHGFYGVDVKQVGKAAYVVEVNDNPSIDANVEDEILGDRLYDAVISSLTDRIKKIRGAEQL